MENNAFSKPSPEAVFRNLSERYRVSADDYGGMLAYLALDESSIPENVRALGLRPEQFRLLRLGEAQNALRARRNSAREKAEGWQKEAADLRIDLKAERQNEEFTRLIRAGFSVKEAYGRIHAGETAQRELLNRIACRAVRPVESAAGTAASARSPSRPALSREDREAIEKRALRGERVKI